MALSPLLLLLINLIAALTQGFSGFGYGIIAMALLSLGGSDLERASVLVTLLSTVLTATLLLQCLRHARIDWRQAGLLIIGQLIGVPLGYRLLLRFGEMPLGRIVFGVVLIAFALNHLFSPHIKRRIPLFVAPLFGLASGILSGAFSSGGPPVVLYLYTQEDDPRRAVGTAQVTFLFNNLYRLAVVACGAKGLPASFVMQSLPYMAIVVGATLLGYRLARRFALRPFMLAVHGLIIFAGCANIYRSIATLFNC